MKRILVVTDFSARADRALRRASLLAHEFGAAITLVYVVDEDQPERLLSVEEREATELLQTLSDTVRSVDQIPCDPRVIVGVAHDAIIDLADEVAADLVVMGPDRGRNLTEVFVGTTLERVIRSSRLPVLMVNAVPAANYARILLAVDMSECSLDAARAVRGFGFDGKADVTTLYLFAAPGVSLMERTPASQADIDRYVAEEKDRARGELMHFMGLAGFDPARSIVRPVSGSAAAGIASVAREISADLVVVGTRGRGGVAKLFLGSVAQEVLRVADRDVLAVPPGAQP